MLSLSSAVALSIKMAQRELKLHKGTIPLDADFFETLNTPHVAIPVAEDVEFHIAKTMESFIDIFDFYLFTVF